MIALICILVLSAGPVAWPAPGIPTSIEAEHMELHHRLEALAGSGGEVGQAAREVERVLAAHFRREEEIALPPLGLLRDLALGKATAGMKPAVAMANALREELPRMLEEHAAIKSTLQALAEAGRKAAHTEAQAFAAELMRHALMEEEILYPAAILAGEKIRLDLP